MPAPTADISTSSKRILPLDGLRGIAALTIFFHHTWYFFSEKEHLFGGYLVVSLFFIISGVVISHVYETNILLGKINFYTFFTHRLARLYPLHLFSLITALIIDLILFSLFYHKHIFMVEPIIFTGFLNLLLLQAVGFGPPCAWVGPSWSISVEMVVNAFWFWLLEKKPSSRLLAAIIALCCILMINGDISDKYHFTEGTPLILGTPYNLYSIVSFYLLTGTVGFLVGCLFQRFIRRRNSEPLFTGTANAILTIPVLAGIALMLLECNHSAFFQGADYIAVFVLFPLLIVLALEPMSLLNRVLSSRLCLFFGKISYSIYLLHVLIWYPIYVIIKAYDLPYLYSPAFGVLLLTVVIAISTTIHHFVERPSRVWVRNIMGKRQPSLQ